MSRISYVAWGGEVRSVPASFELGVAASPPPRELGLRRALWDAAYGHVNGFPASAIAYYLLTRSLSRRAWVWAFHAEQRRGHHPADMRMLPDGNFTYEPEERP